MFQAYQPPLADFADILPKLLPLIIGALYVLFQVISAASGRNAQKPGLPRPGERPLPKVPRPQQPPVPQAGQQPGQPMDPAQEVAEFLRKVVARKTGQEQETMRDVPPMPSKTGKTNRPGPKKKSPSAQPKVVSAELVKSPPPPPSMSVSESVRRHLDSGTFTSRAEQLSSLGKAEQQFDSHLRSTFEHRLGSLGQSDMTSQARSESASEPGFGEAAPRSTSAPVNFAALLGNLNDARKAVILNEIFSRPVDRW